MHHARMSYGHHLLPSFQCLMFAYKNGKRIFLSDFNSTQWTSTSTKKMPAWIIWQCGYLLMRFGVQQCWWCIVEAWLTMKFGLMTLLHTYIKHSRQASARASLASTKLWFYLDCCGSYAEEMFGHTWDIVLIYALQSWWHPRFLMIRNPMQKADTAWRCFMIWSRYAILNAVHYTKKYTKKLAFCIMAC